MTVQHKCRIKGCNEIAKFNLHIFHDTWIGCKTSLCQNHKDEIIEKIGDWD